MDSKLFSHDYLRALGIHLRPLLGPWTRTNDMWKIILLKVRSIDGFIVCSVMIQRSWVQVLVGSNLFVHNFMYWVTLGFLTLLREGQVNSIYFMVNNAPQNLHIVVIMDTFPILELILFHVRAIMYTCSVTFACT